jgi:hypothetical protein
MRRDLERLRRGAEGADVRKLALGCEVADMLKVIPSEYFEYQISQRSRLIRNRVKVACNYKSLHHECCGIAYVDMLGFCVSVAFAWAKEV